jgi:tetratricopeptide (TPR) repeat protein
MGFLAVSFDEHISARANTVVRPPSFDAYREFAEGLGIYLKGDGGDKTAIPHFYRAFSLDTTFVVPLHYAIFTHINLREWAQADSLVGILERFRDRLSEYDRRWLDYLKARVHGDYTAAYAAIHRASELAPGSKAVYTVALIAHRLNRPQEALGALLSLDPERGPMRGWASYFVSLRRAYLALGEYQRALESAQKFREIFGNTLFTLSGEALCLAALGRVEEVNEVLDEMIALPEQGPYQRYPLYRGYLMTQVAAYLRRHGHADAGSTTVGRVTQWFETRTPETRATALWRSYYAWALYVANRWDEAHGVAKSLSEELPEDLNYRGLVGVLAARRGYRDEAVDMSQWLEDLDRPYLRGAHTALRSQIAGALGDGENAVALWRQASAEGFDLPRPWDLVWISFEPICDYAPFQELVRPKG